MDYLDCDGTDRANFGHERYAFALLACPHPLAINVRLYLCLAP